MKLRLTTIGIISLALFSSCGGDGNASKDKSQAKAAEPAKEEVYDVMKDKGIGPVTSVTLGELDQTLVDAGKEKFDVVCAACHKLDQRLVGPALAGVTTRRTPEWIMNMILNPTEMIKENKTAKELLIEYSAPMANQNLTEEEARSVLEYFRTI